MAVLVGDNPASHTYIRMKRTRCAEAGMESRCVELPCETTTTERARLITPVSGGVGPMSIAVLLEQTLVAARVTVSQ